MQAMIEFPYYITLSFGNISESVAEILFGSHFKLKNCFAMFLNKSDCMRKTVTRVKKCSCYIHGLKQNEIKKTMCQQPSVLQKNMPNTHIEHKLTTQNVKQYTSSSSYMQIRTAQKSKPFQITLSKMV